MPGVSWAAAVAAAWVNWGWGVLQLCREQGLAAQAGRAAAVGGATDVCKGETCLYRVGCARRVLAALG